MGAALIQAGYIIACVDITCTIQMRRRVGLVPLGLLVGVEVAEHRRLVEVAAGDGSRRPRLQVLERGLL